MVYLTQILEVYSQRGNRIQKEPYLTYRTYYTPKVTTQQPQAHLGPLNLQMNGIDKFQPYIFNHNLHYLHLLQCIDSSGDFLVSELENRQLDY